MFLGAVLQSNGLVEIELPSWCWRSAICFLAGRLACGLREILVLCHPGFTENDSINF